MTVYNDDADLEVSDICVRNSLLSCVELSIVTDYLHCVGVMQWCLRNILEPISFNYKTSAFAFSITRHVRLVAHKRIPCILLLTRYISCCLFLVESMWNLKIDRCGGWSFCSPSSIQCPSFLCVLNVNTATNQRFSSPDVEISGIIC